jgi:hypothetical protein
MKKVFVLLTCLFTSLLVIFVIRGRKTDELSSSSDQAPKTERKGNSAQQQDGLQPVERLGESVPSKTTEWTATTQQFSPRIASFVNRFKTPIEFYGKVIDKNGNPVEGATVGLGWTDESPSGYSSVVSSNWLDI